MRKAIETLKNIWKIEDLRQRILITILFVAIYRFGSYVVLPGINPAMLTQLHKQTSEGLVSLVKYVLWRSIFQCLYFCIGNHAVYLCIHCNSVVGNCCSVFPEIAARR